MTNLLKSAQHLQQQALEILDDLKLFDKLGEIGKPSLIGSVKNGLMIWRDIDLEVYVKKHDLNSYLDFINKLTVRRDIVAFGSYDLAVRKVSKSDLRGVYVYFVLKDKVGNEWKLDIWFLDFIPQPRSYEKFMSGITNEQKIAVLSIKKEMLKTPLYKKYIISIDVYKAVLEGGVKNFEDFKLYMAKEGRHIIIKRPDDFNPE